ncbi:MAG: YbaK/EbsC family protein [Pseudomonadota bacterium]
MSKSLKRVRAALADLGLPDTTQEMPDSTRTAEDAARACGCALDQIVKSMVFEREGALVLLLIAGGNQAPAELGGAPLSRADPQRVRAETGFAIGGVAPIGHLSALPVYLDPRLLEFDLVWAAAGTPRHVFSVNPDMLRTLISAETLPL